MLKTTLHILFFSLLSSFVFAQDSLNVTDANGLKQGTWKGRHQDGRVRYIGQFKDNKPVGEFKYYGPEGEFTKKIIFKNDSAFATFYHTSANKMAEGVYIKEQKQGVWKYYDEEGDISIQEAYKDGKRNGPSRVYYKTGAITRECGYKQDLMHGQCTDYFKSGKKKFEGEYLDGNLDGKVTHYNPNGTPWLSGTYKAAVRDGKWLTYNENGELLKIEVFNLGKLIDTQIIKEENETPDSD